MWCSQIRSRVAVLLLALAALVLPVHSMRVPRMAPYRLARHDGAPPQLGAPPRGAGTAACSQRWRATPLDHADFSAGAPLLRQRYFVCDRAAAPGGPIFFYFGNEADVELYVNNTGLMWDLAPRFGATLVFAEHRYYGQSLPRQNAAAGSGADGGAGAASTRARRRAYLRHLTTEAALADYAGLVAELRAERRDDPGLAVVGFGGSYGGMLAAWARLRYPHLVDGSIAASAPIWAYEGEDPAYDPGGFARVVTRDATPAAGAAAACAPAARAAWAAARAAGAAPAGRAALAAAMRLCPAAAPRDAAGVEAVVQWAAAAFDYLAMGDYPYASSYMTSGGGLLPPWPMRAACARLAAGAAAAAAAGGAAAPLLAGLADAVGVFYNASGAAGGCFDPAAGASGAQRATEELWGYSYCTEQFMPFSKAGGGPDGGGDMFWAEPWNAAAAAAACGREWGVAPRRRWAATAWGGARRLAGATNLVLSNGALDPWSAGGVLEPPGPGVTVLPIADGAHHLDLFFERPEDPPSVRAARAAEAEAIARWVDERRAACARVRARPAAAAVL